MAAGLPVASALIADVEFPARTRQPLLPVRVRQRLHCIDNGGYVWLGRSVLFHCLQRRVPETVFAPRNVQRKETLLLQRTDQFPDVATGDEIEIRVDVHAGPQSASLTLAAQRRHRIQPPRGGRE